MSLARRLGWTDRRGYVPVVFAVTAFALGVQLALFTESFGSEPYPPEGKATLAWVSGIVLAASAILHVPWQRIKDEIAEMGDSLGGSSIPNRAVFLAPADPRRGREGAGERTNGHHDAGPADLKARVHSPLSAGPVVAPDEEIDVLVEAEPEELARELQVGIEVRGPTGARSTRTRMPGTQLEHTLSFEEPGEFTVSIELEHPRSDPASKTLRGRVATYREEVGRLFEVLKEEAERAGLDVTPGSTPREVCRELRELPSAEPRQLADLAVELEVALYGDDEVDRSTYETVHEAIASTDLLAEPSREVHR